jgi:hypothetical protein
MIALGIEDSRSVHIEKLLTVLHVDHRKMVAHNFLRANISIVPYLIIYGALPLMNPDSSLYNSGNLLP